MVTDPVCLTQLDARSAKITAEYRGQIYYFDSEHCRSVFESDPDQYVAAIPTETYGDKGRTYES